VAAIDRWRKWRPSGEESGESLEYEPSKPPKPPFEGFEGSVSGQTPIFSDTLDPGASPNTAELGSFRPQDTAEWRKPFARWVSAVCVRDPRCAGGVGCLHVAFCEWAIAQDDVPCKRFTFECLLRESGLAIDEVAGVVLVSGLTFREDSEAVGIQAGAGGNSSSARK
jgi:hypothetical protein